MLDPIRLHSAMRTVCTAVFLAVAIMHAVDLAAQVPVEGEVRQIVTFTFVPGESAGALDIYRDEALPLYRDDGAMLSFRGFREVESPVPLDLVVVSSFSGMAGMDASNATLASLSAQRGTTIGSIYGRIAGKSSGHTDQFVEMLPRLGAGDPSSRRLTVFVWYRVTPGQSAAFERAVADILLPLERASAVPAASGRSLISDGWDYVRFLGFDSLGEYQAYWTRFRMETMHGHIDSLTAARREIIVTLIPSLSIR